MTEAELQKIIVKAATANGWLVYHSPTGANLRQKGMLKSSKGWPDLFLVSFPHHRAIELKSQTGVVSSEQHRWLQQLKLSGIHVSVIRPDNLDEILAWLENPLACSLEQHIELEQRLHYNSVDGFYSTADK